MEGMDKKMNIKKVKTEVNNSGRSKRKYQQEEKDEEMSITTIFQHEFQRAFHTLSF